jgi:hypothetical protein
MGPAGTNREALKQQERCFLPDGCCNRADRGALSKNFVGPIAFFFLTTDCRVLYSIVRLDYGCVCNPHLGIRFEEVLRWRD